MDYEPPHLPVGKADTRPVSQDLGSGVRDSAQLCAEPSTIGISYFFRPTNLITELLPLWYNPSLKLTSCSDSSIISKFLKS